MLAAILAVAGVVLLIVWAVTETGGTRDDEAVRILRSRFARGEMDAAQFAAAPQTLGGTAPTPRRRSMLLMGVGFLSAGLILLLLAGSLMGAMIGPEMVRMTHAPTPSA
jgi:hypothetical protein